MKTLIIGSGNMGMTYAQSLLRSKVVTNDQLMILCRTYEKANHMAAQADGRFYSDPALCLHEADIVILAVKPQDSAKLFEQIKAFVHPEQLFISIMAGVKISTIAQSLGVEKVIRAMPNLPAQVGQGITSFTSSDAVTRIELVMVQNLLSTTGKTLYVAQEEMIDASTAISGSGPAYVYFFMQAMMEAAQSMGFQPSEAELLVAQTFSGAVDLYNKENFSCAEWIKRVASKGRNHRSCFKYFSIK